MGGQRNPEHVSGGSKGDDRNQSKTLEERQKDFEAKRKADLDARRKAEEEKGVWDTVRDNVSDFFSGKEEQGFSPLGGASSYGMSKKQFDETIGKSRYESLGLGSRISREIDYFQEAPMDYVSDLLDNPMVAGGAMMAGLGVPAFGLKVVDAAMDLAQNEASPMEALSNVGMGALSFTPVGASLPSEVKSLAKAGIKRGVEGVALKGSGILGGKIGTGLGSQLAESFTDNPLARVGMTAASAAAGAWAGKEATKTAMAKPSTSPAISGMQQPTAKDRGRSESPLVSSGEAAVASSKALMQQPNVDLYASTVKSLPYYGLSPELSGNKQPYYGV